MKKILLFFALLSALTTNAEVIDGINYGFNYDARQASVTSGGEYTGSITIPETVTYDEITLSVTSIGDYAFFRCSGLVSVTIPNSVTSIGESAFQECSDLISVTIPNSVKSIGDYVFYGCRGIASIEIPNSVTSIGKRAFDGCPGLKSVTIPNSMTSIGDGAFEGCSGLKSVTIPNSVKSIGDYAFYCSGLTSVTIPNSVKSIGMHAFTHCSSLTSVSIPNSVTSIGYAAFYCSGLTSVTIPSSVTSIGNGTFAGCSGLASIIVESGNAKYDSRDNCNAIIETATNKLVQGCKNTIISNSVTSIGNSAFQERYSLTSVTIPSSVTLIEDCAFYGCRGLSSIIISNSILSIGKRVFESCSDLTEVYCYAENVPNTGRDAFDNVNLNNATLYVPATSIEAYQAAEPWSGFGTIKAIENETVISGSCGENVTFTLDTGTGVLSITGTGDMTWENDGDRYEDRTYYVPWDEQKKYIKSVVISDGVTNIGYYAFSGCSELTSIEIPNSVTEIAGWAFQNCSSMTSVTIPSSVTRISNNAFSYCSDLTSVNIPANVIEKYAFYCCGSLNSLTISASSIGTQAFAGCSGLTSLTFTKSSKIGELAFYNCSNLTSITCESNMPPSVYTAGGGDSFEGVSSCTVTVPYGTRDAYIANGWTSSWITEIEPSVYSGSCGDNVNYSFDTSTGVLSITGTGAMTDYSSENRAPWYEQRENIKSIEISDGVTSIGDFAFDSCYDLASVDIPNSVTSIGTCAFRSCHHITTVDIPNGVTEIGAQAFERCDWLASIDIPNSVTSIGKSAFEHTALTTVIIGNGVTSIGEGIFNYCNCITSIIVSDENTKYDSRDNCNAIIETATNTLIIGCKNTIIPNSVTSIGGCAFYGSGLTSIEIPNSVTSIGSDAFGRCHSLTSVTIPNSVTEIGPWAFCDCNSLTSVTIPNSVTSIQACAFNRCGLTSVTIPNSVTSIEERVFEDCSGLESVTIPNSVTSIGYAAFNRCTGLTSIEIPGSVTEIREEAFNDCSSLTEVYCYAENVPNTEANVFKNVDINNATLYVPAASIEAYQAAEPWSQFGNIMKIDTDISQMDNVMYVESFEGHSASQVIMPIQMKNSAEIRGFQFNLYLPDGVTIALNPKGKEMVSLSPERRDEYDEHTLSVRKQDDGSYLFLCGSLSEDTFLGNDGEVATVTLDIAEEMDNGNYPIILKNIKLTENDISKYYETPQVRSTMTVVSYMLGDINDDGKVDVSDYIGIANHILGNTPEDFNIRAADVDENGVIDVSDYIGVANIILTGSIYGSQQ